MANRGKKKQKSLKKPVHKAPDYEIAYICTGKNPKCMGQPGCYYCKTTAKIGSCMHTLNPEHAKNGVIRDHPRNHQDRFDRYTYGEGDEKQVRYYEKFEEKWG